MKNLKKVKLPSLIALVVIMVLSAVSCTPEVEVTDYDWTAVNESNDPRYNGGNSDFDINASIQYPLIYGADSASSIIIGINVNITFDPQADILKKSEIKAEDLNFITFHTFTKPAADAAFDAVDTLSNAIPFTLEKVKGNVLSVKLTTSIDTTKDYSDIIAKIDGKKCTYNNGTRFDIDANGKIEDIYDDYGYASLSLSGSKIKGNDFVYPGHQGFAIDIPNSISNVVDTLPANTTAPTGVNEFVFIGTAQTTNTKTFYVIKSADFDSGFKADVKAFIDDVLGTLAKGIKLQKLSASGDKWEDYKTAEYDSTVRSGTALEASTTGGNTYILFKDVSFEHFATYRVIWTGSAYTETTGTYFGVKQRIYISNGNPTGAARYTRTEVAGTRTTFTNTNLHVSIPTNPNPIPGSAYSYDSEGRNVILRVELNDSNGQYFWNNTEEEIKNNLKVAYARQNPTSPNNNASVSSMSNTTENLLYVNVVKVELKDEYKGGGAAISATNPTGNNVAYITLDPNFSKDIVSAVFFRINKNVSVTNKLTGALLETYYFGSTSPIYDYYAFYGPIYF